MIFTYVHNPLILYIPFILRCSGTQINEPRKHPLPPGIQTLCSTCLERARENRRDPESNGRTTIHVITNLLYHILT